MTLLISALNTVIAFILQLICNRERGKIFNLANWGFYLLLLTQRQKEIHILHFTLCLFWNVNLSFYLLLLKHVL